MRSSLYKVIKSAGIAWFLLLTTYCLAQNPVPVAKQSKSILLEGGTIHIGNGQVIENGLLGFKDGKITLVTDATNIKLQQGLFDTVIQTYGKHIYPAFIAPNSTLGLTEVDEVRATKDFNEIGGYNPHIRALIAFNTDSKINPTVRTNGVLYAQACPRGGVISGTSSVLALEGWNWEDAVLKADDGIHLNFPRSMKHHGWGEANPGPSQNEKLDEQVNELKKFFADAKAYHASPVKEEKNLRYEAMKGVLNGTQNLYIHTDYVKDIIGAVNFCKSAGIKKCVIVGGKDAWKVTKLLRENNVAVMVNRVHDLPEYSQEDVDLPYKLPFLLQKDSVLFCLNNAGDMEAMNARNIPFLAGTACAYGLTKEQAIASISYNTAKILGLDNKIGSLEAEKNASLIVSEGDALDMRTNNIIHAFVDGKRIMLTNSQQELYKKYMSKYQLNKK
ncbi:MAG: amidohydrolase family protein [Bacteroidia bacterium]